jgi:hypothetical protein
VEQHGANPKKPAQAGFFTGRYYDAGLCAFFAVVLIPQHQESIRMAMQKYQVVYNRPVQGKPAYVPKI